MDSHFLDHWSPIKGLLDWPVEQLKNWEEVVPDWIEMVACVPVDVIKLLHVLHCLPTLSGKVPLNFCNYFCFLKDYLVPYCFWVF